MYMHNHISIKPQRLPQRLWHACTLALGMTLGCTFMADAVRAQAASPVFKNENVNEAALVEALRPGPVSDMGMTRSFKVVPLGSATPPAIPSQPPQASMLITFETNSADLTPKARDMLDVLGRALRSDQLSSFHFSIEGHADPRGTSELNRQLSQLRADSVVRYLTVQQGIDINRLSGVGKGDAEQLNPSDPTAPENRRVTVKTLVQ